MKIIHTLFDQSLKARCDWRDGFLSGLERNLELQAPRTLADNEVESRCQDSKSFAQGYQEGLTCSVACGAEMPDEFEGGDQYVVAAWVAGLFVILAIGLLFYGSQV